MLESIEVSLTLESTVLELCGLGSKIILFFLQTPVLQSIKVQWHFFKSHLNPNTRLGLRPSIDRITFATARLVVFLKNGRALCWKLSIESLQLVQKYFDDGDEKHKKKKDLQLPRRFFHFCFQLVEQWHFSRGLCLGLLLTTRWFTQRLRFVVWRLRSEIYVKCIIDISTARPTSSRICANGFYVEKCY